MQSGSYFDQDTQTKIRQLEQDKQISIQNENFELAKHLKIQIDRLRAVHIQLQNLEAQKNIALTQDNYDEAKRIKISMEQLKYSSMMQANANLYNADLPPYPMVPQQSPILSTN